MRSSGKKRTRLLMAGILFLLMLAGCTLPGCNGVRRNGSGNQEEFDYLITVGLVQSGGPSTWKTANTESFKSIFIEDNGYELLYEDAMQDQEKQQRAVRKFISEGVDYIIVSPVVETGWRELLEETREAGIPVILINRLIDDIDTSLYECWIGTDFHRQALDIGEWLETYLESQEELEEEKEEEKEKEENEGDRKEQEDGSKVKDDTEEDELIFAAIQGMIGSYEQMERAAGYEEFLEEHDDWNMLGRQTGENQREAGKEVMKLFLEQVPLPDVVIAEDEEMALGAAEAIKEAKTEKEIILISCGAGQEVMEAIKDGSITVAFEQNPLIARKTAEIIQKLEAGVTVDKRQYIDGDHFDASMDLEMLSEESTY